MKTHRGKRRLWTIASITLAVGSLIGVVWAGERQFLVILATSPKEFGGQPGPLFNPERVNEQYFDNDPDNDITSFLEYWQEISYGDVTIAPSPNRDKVTDWISLPWRITQSGGSGGFFDLNQSNEYEYGASERFRTDRAMVIVDLNGDPPGADDGPLSVEGNPDYAQGGEDTTPIGGEDVWMPGERFVDMDGDGRWDGLDEARNWMDFFTNGTDPLSGVPDGLPDLAGPWIDLDEDGTGNNSANCVYLTDSDNDGNPDCCPDGPGTPGCEPFPERGACLPTRWTGPQGDINDCNGNLVPDACDISCLSQACLATGWTGPCGGSFDRLPLSAGATACDTQASNNIPDECEFRDAERDCVDSPPDPDSGDACVGAAACSRIQPSLDSGKPTRCEFVDSNGNNQLDIVEPFENFLRRWDTENGEWVSLAPALCRGGAKEGQLCTSLSDCPDGVCPDLTCFGGGNDGQACDGPQDCPGGTCSSPGRFYIVNNYPGDPERLMARATVRRLFGQHDPLSITPGFGLCRCADGSSCQNVIAPDGHTQLFNVCKAGEHAQYDPPDSWEEVGSTKVINPRLVAEAEGDFLEAVTPEPPWYKQAWVDRYGTEPPDWYPFGGRCTPGPSSVNSGGDCDDDSDCPGGRCGALTPNVSSIALESPNQRRCFRASRGGVTGQGTGWVGCSILDPDILFGTAECLDPDETPGPDSFDQACDARILPEEINGIGATLTLFDGFVEHDDLPSSKYHRAGDQHLGEVTSPFSENIWGEDRGRNEPGVINFEPDDVLPAAGPYATSIHANFGRDAGNLLHMEILTFRVEPPFCTAAAWFRDAALDPNSPPRTHPLATTSGANLGFRDFNLDGLPDQGEVRFRGSENYITGPDGLGDGTSSEYPWNRRRLLEDCIEVLDDVIDFDDFVDVVSLDRIGCDRSPPAALVPEALLGGGRGPSVLNPHGVLSGIVLLPDGAHALNQFPTAPRFYPIHNEDGLGDEQYLDVNLPRSARDLALEPDFKPQINWNLFVHDLVICTNCGSPSGTSPTATFQVPYSAHEYLHTWEKFPDLYDYDVFDEGAIVNCPIGRWDIMADGGLVHPGPILKAQFCTGWTEPVDLTTILTPGVDTVLTLPPAEFVRDESYYFLENQNRPGERDYFWSAGQGFDENLPGSGMLIQHTDVGSNFDAVPQQQRSGDRPAFLMVQADGNGDLQACSAGGNRGDDGDPWPGSTGATEFSFDTNPAATWYSQASWNGINISDVLPDGSGSVQLTINWVPTSLPSLRFVDPPGGQSVAGRFNVRVEATDVYGGTKIRLFYLSDDKTCSGSGASCVKDSDCSAGQLCRHDITLSADNLIWSLGKTSGRTQLRKDWNISGLPDGRYVLVAKLNPGPGADGTENKNTEPRAGRNNLGNGTLTIRSVAIDDDGDDSDDRARLETWTAVCIDPNGQDWLVNSTLTQPVINEDDPTQDPWPKATTGQEYTSVGGEVRFTINVGTVPFRLGDSFSFTTTGITAVSQPVTVLAGEISENPVARIIADPLAGDPPLTVVLDGRDSVDPNGDSLSYTWSFGDGTEPANGDLVEHSFVDAGTFNVRLKVTNPAGLFGETSVDIQVTNNSPKAVISALPLSGAAPLTVQFNGSQSSDTETPANELIYQWDFGDGTQPTNSAATPGVGISPPAHTYRDAEDGTACTADNACTFNPTLTVTDALGKSNIDTVRLIVGNTNPVPNVTATPQEGPAPLEVRFNAINSFDPDGDTITIDWFWGDGTSVVNQALGGSDGTGVITHSYSSPGTYTPTATLRDEHGATAVWPGVAITVTVNKAPEADFRVSPETGIAGVTVFTFDASPSRDPDGNNANLTYAWSFGDENTATGLVVTHVYTLPDEVGYLVKLTVTDERGASTTATPQRVVVKPNPGNRNPIAHIATFPTTCSTPCTLTLDGSLSFDRDEEDTISHRWEFFAGDELIDALLGAKVEKTFTTAGTFQIFLQVTDGRGGVDRAGPETVLVTANGDGPPVDQPPGQDVPEDPSDEPPDSSLQRPSGAMCGALCGPGMIMAVFACLLGLRLMAASRRRRF